MSAPTTRRASLAALAGFIAVPTLPAAAASAPSEIVALCNRAVAHMAWVNDTSHPLEDWPDERTDAEVKRFDAMLAEVADRPSAGLADIQAKARLVLADRGSDLSEPGAPPYERVLYRLLREVAALGGVA